MFEKDAWVAHEDIVNQIRELRKSKGKKYEPDPDSPIRHFKDDKGTGKPGLDGNLMRCRNCDDYIQEEEDYIRAAVRMNVLFPHGDVNGEDHPPHRTRIVNIHTDCQAGKTHKCPKCGKEYRNWDQHKVEHQGPISAVKSSIKTADLNDILRNLKCPLCGNGVNPAEDCTSCGATLDEMEEAQLRRSEGTYGSFQKGAPYGISKDVGGDTPEHTKKMEDCVNEVMADGKSKKSAIKICKSSLQKYWRKKHKSHITKNAHCGFCGEEEKAILDNMPPCQDPHCKPRMSPMPSGWNPVHSNWCTINPRQKVRHEDTIDPELWLAWDRKRSGLPPKQESLQDKIYSMLLEDELFIKNAQDGGGGDGGGGGSTGGDGGGSSSGGSDGGSMSGDGSGAPDTGAGGESLSEGPHGEGKPSDLVIGPSKEMGMEHKCGRCGEKCYSTITAGFYYWSCPNCGWTKRKKKKIEATNLVRTIMEDPTHEHKGTDQQADEEIVRQEITKLERPRKRLHGWKNSP